MKTWARGYITFFMLNSTEHEISTANKNYPQIKKYFGLNLLDAVLIMLINVKMPTIVGILTFMSRINYVLSLAEHEKSFTTWRPDQNAPEDKVSCSMTQHSAFTWA